MIALGLIIFGELIDDVIQLLRENHVGEFASQTINSIIAGEFDSDLFTTQLGELITNVRQSISSVRLPWGGVTMSYVLFCVIFIVYRMLVSLTDVAAACQLEEFMTSNASRPFTWFFFKKQGKTWNFVILQTLLTLPFDILIVCGTVGFYLMFLLAFNWWTIIPVGVIALLFYVARQTLFAFCLPAVTVQEEMSVRSAFRLGLSKIISRFWHVFWKTLIVICLMAAISVVCVLYIGNSILSTVATTVPNFVLFFYLKCVNIVEYFNTDNRPFFYKRVDVEGTERYERKLARQAKKQAK